MNSDDQALAIIEAAPEVVRIAQCDLSTLQMLMAGWQLTLHCVPDDEAIPASYWGEGEAGVIGATVYARGDTPLHSVLHTAAHLRCMSPERRATIHTDCGSDDQEEVAACYLQVLMADAVPGFGRRRLFADMDSWGYHFRLGSARAWFEQDADDARQGLQARGLL